MSVVRRAQKRKAGPSEKEGRKVKWFVPVVGSPTPTTNQSVLAPVANSPAPATIPSLLAPAIDASAVVPDSALNGHISVAPRAQKRKADPGEKDGRKIKRPFSMVTRAMKRKVDLEEDADRATKRAATGVNAVESVAFRSPIVKKNAPGTSKSRMGNATQNPRPTFSANPKENVQRRSKVSHATDKSSQPTLRINATPQFPERRSVRIASRTVNGKSSRPLTT